MLGSLTKIIKLPRRKNKAKAGYRGKKEKPGNSNFKVDNSRSFNLKH